ncbi:DUF5004 domain-containing protein [Solitalea sp. MAHUQ-68]|uniref:DUF5004 domain-containing protein n=1 Tax=Solitalea agri TaxID=2953739 RepID=A0A9X2F444_9SPHI|nr:DUF5004 domain-containing protein [Solitalea agri]MCO4291991.1 DUF5004 domain-containing protein [Solitalea agri]
MKTKSQHALFGCLMFLALATTTSSCEKKDDGSYVAPITRYEKVQGQWQLTGLNQTDELAKSTGGSLTQVNLYGKFNFKDMQITFNVDAENNPTSYSVSGNAPELFTKQGFWQMDAAFTTGKTAKIFLYSDEAKTQKIDELEVTTMPGATTNMDLRLVRTSAGTPFLSYQFSLKPVE